MRVMVFGKFPGGSAPSEPPTPEAFAAMDRFTDELVAAGILVAAAGLRNDADARRITATKDSQTVADGPFPLDAALIAGFSIWQVRDMDEAVAWARCHPMPGELELRPFYEAEDLAEFLTPEELASPRDGDRGKLGVA